MILRRRRGECVHLCVCLGAGEEERGIFLFNLPSQDWWLETAHPLSDSGDLCVWHGIIWYSTLPGKTTGRAWKLNKDRLSLLRGVVGECRVQEGANLLLFLPVLCDTNLSPLAKAIPCVSKALELGQMNHCTHSLGQGCTSPAPLGMAETGDVFLNYPGKDCIFPHAKIKKGFHYLLLIEKKILDAFLIFCKWAGSVWIFRLVRK